MGIQKFVFFSIHNCDKHPEVPLMQIKFCTEKFLRDIGLNHIIIRLCGFMQVLSTPHRSCCNPFFTFCYLFLVYLKLVCYTYTLHITHYAAECLAFEHCALDFLYLEFGTRIGHQSWESPCIIGQGLARTY